MPQLSTDEYPAGRWSNKCRGGWGNTYEKPRDEENCPPNLDYKVIEQIADGVEKMILAWSHGEERGAHAPRSPVTNPAASSRTSVMKGSQKPMKMKSPLSEKRFQGEAGCNYVCPVQLQDLPGGVTAEISINGNCHGAGMGSAISQITIELKIKLKSLQSTPKHSDDSKSGCAEKDQTHYNKNSRESQIVESMKKQLFKLQREKGAVTKEYLSLQKKERKFEVQKRNLEDALVRVNRLQRELVRKDQELMDCQLMEKHIQAKLQEAEAHVKTSHRSPEPPPGVEPAKLVALLPSLREWVKTLKKDRAYEPAMIKLMEGYCMKGEPNRTEPFRPRSANERLLHSDGSRKEFETVVHSLVKEVQALQKELGKLGSRSWKNKNQSLPAWRNGLENRQGGRLAAGGSPPYTFKRLYNR
ncbi:unnamed protein product [Calypogeia fissa]